MRAYWMLFTREEDGRWYAQFGAYFRKEVLREARDSYMSYKLYDLKVVKLPDDTDRAFKMKEAELNESVRV